MGRAPCCDKGNVKKGPWCPEEDEKLKSYIQNHGTGGNWITLPHKIGLKRCGKSCRLRWLNYLRPNIKHGGFSHEEDSIICSLYIAIGSRWSIIAAQLPGRTDNDIKNHWNTKLKTMLLGAKNNNKNRAAAAPSSSSRPYEYANAAGAPAGAQYYDTTTTTIHNNYYSVLQIMSSMGAPDVNHHVMSTTFPGNSNYATHHDDDDDRSSQLDVAPSLFILPHYDLPAASMHHHHHQDPAAATAPAFSSWIPQSDTIFNQDGSPPPTWPTWPNYDHVFPPAHHHHHHDQEGY